MVVSTNYGYGPSTSIHQIQGGIKINSLKGYDHDIDHRIRRNILNIGKGNQLTSLICRLWHHNLISFDPTYLSLLMNKSD